MGKIHKKLSKGEFVKIAEIGKFKIWCFLWEVARLNSRKTRKWYFLR